MRRRRGTSETSAEFEKSSKDRRRRKEEKQTTHQASLGQVTTEPSGSTVFPGGTRQDFPSLLTVVPSGQRHVPAWHVEPPRQTAPQAPHEVLDVARLVQAPEQHATAMLALQAVPHEPQF